MNKDNKKEPFFIDGAPIKRDKIQRLKILRQKGVFRTAFSQLTPKFKTAL